MPDEGFAAVAIETAGLGDPGAAGTAAATLTGLGMDAAEGAEGGLGRTADGALGMEGTPGTLGGFGIAGIAPGTEGGFGIPTAGADTDGGLGIVGIEGGFGRDAGGFKPTGAGGGGMGELLGGVGADTVAAGGVGALGALSFPDKLIRTVSFLGSDIREFGWLNCAEKSQITTRVSIFHNAAWFSTKRDITAFWVWSRFSA